VKDRPSAFLRVALQICLQAVKVAWQAMPCSSLLRGLTTAILTSPALEVLNIRTMFSASAALLVQPPPPHTHTADAT